MGESDGPLYLGTPVGMNPKSTMFRDPVALSAGDACPVMV